MSRAARDLSRITRTTPLLLADAATLAFPDGSMLPATLRREAAKGKLTVWKLGNKLRTNLDEIDRMLERCRVPASQPDSGSDQKEGDGSQFGSSSTTDASTAQAAALMRAERLKQRFAPTSKPNTIPPLRAVARQAQRP